MKQSTKAQNPVNSPTAWFCELESARIRGDAARASRAEKELARLGVKVEFGEPVKQEKPLGVQRAQ